MRSIIFDIDGCLVDTTYRSTIDLDRFRNLVNKGISRGIGFSMNSNRSLEYILDFYRIFGFNGKIIGECGAFFYSPSTGETEGYFNSQIDRDKLVDTLRGFSDDILFCDTDSALKVRHDKKKIFLEDSRRYTMTVYPRDYTTEMTYNEEMLDEVKAVLMPEFKDYSIESNMVYGNILLTPNGLSKGALMGKIEGPKAAFGDTEQDISMMEASDFRGAPGNCTPGMKEYILESGGFQSDKVYTAAAYEFIQEVMGTCASQ